MEELKVKNLDESGNEIDNISWDEWCREKIEEETDETGKVISIISRCRKLNDAEKRESLLSALAISEDEDVQAALCELAEQQAAYENDVNAALCELYELIEKGSGNNG